MAKYKTEQIEAIQIDYGIVYVDYGEATERRLGPTRGGATFEVMKELRDIEYDGRIGKSKLQVIDAIDAVLKVVNLDTSHDNLKLAMPYLVETGIDPDLVLEATEASIGLIADGKYNANITMFAKLVGGGYKKIVLFNALNESDFSIAAVQKAEGTVSLEIYAHWEVDEDDVTNVDKLFTVEEVAAIV